LCLASGGVVKVVSAIELSLKGDSMQRIICVLFVLATPQFLTAAKDDAAALANVTDADLQLLKDLPDLRVLALHQCDVTDAGLEHLAGLTNLLGLHFGSNKITDDGLKHFKKLTALRSLTLGVPKGHFGGGNPITDSGLEHLRGLTNLEELNMSATAVTKVGVKRLQQALPKLKISGNRSQVGPD
jgi:Leucine-rich repeat (LRR) protein